jgi:RHS repeat-associated protein
MRHVAAGGNWTRTYTYNDASLIEPGKVGNRLSQTTLGNGPNRIENYSHDIHGNITSMPHLPTMVRDFEDQLQQVTSGIGETTYYVYDNGGQRVRKVTDSAAGVRQRERIYLGGFEIYRDYAANGTTINLERETLHIMDDQQRIAMVETRTQGAEPGIPVQLTRYQLGNHLGSASVELDDVGALIGYEEYHPYGTTAFQAGRSAAEVNLKRYRYTGKERDEETGFTYYGGRYYVCWLGIWTTFDPALLINKVSASNSTSQQSDEERNNIDLESPGAGDEKSSENNNGAGDGQNNGLMGTLKYNGYCYALDNPIVIQDPDGWKPVPIGHVYVVRGTLGGKSVTYVGSTAQELLKRVGKHKWNTLIKSESTTVTTYQVKADLKKAASNRGTIFSARNEALRSAEQKILSQVKKGKDVSLNEISAAKPENVAIWRKRHNVSLGRAKLTLRGGVRVSAFAGFALLDAFDFYRQEKLSRYEFAPYILEDEGGLFTLSEERAHWFAHHYRWKVYKAGPNKGHKVEINESEFDFWKEEGKLLWGTTDFFGDFVPGLLNPRLPVVEKYQTFEVI